MRAWAKKAGSARGSDTPRQCRPVKSMSPTRPSLKVTRSLCSPMTLTAMGATSFSMAGILAQGSDRVQWLFVGGELPSGIQLLGVELGPGLYEAQLASREVGGDDLAGMDARGV